MTQALGVALLLLAAAAETGGDASEDGSDDCDQDDPGLDPGGDNDDDGLGAPESVRHPPVFVSHANLVLDTTRTLILDARVAVEDPDSSWVKMTLEEAPQGMVLARRIGGGLEAQLEWTPSPAQLNGPIAPTFFAVAEDGDH